MERPQPFLLLDCRSFTAYNRNHIQGALNMNCADRFSRRRLAGGKCRVADLVCGSEGKASFNELISSDIVLYDDDTTEPADLPPCSPVRVVVAALAREGRHPYVLAGGLKAFQKDYSHLCSGPVGTEQGDRLYSPTTPIVEPQIESAKICQVLPYLYLGNARDSADLATLQELGVTHVLNTTAHLPEHWADRGDITYCRLAANDSAQQDLAQHFTTAFQFIEEARSQGGKVLIHCQAGVSRSATITISYIMRRTNLSMVEAYKYVKSKRAIIAPNFNFMGQLLEFEQSLKEGKVERSLCPELVLDH